MEKEKQQLYEKYQVLEMNLEKRKSKRVIKCFIITTLLIIFLFIQKKHAFFDSIEELIFIILGSMILAVADIFIHLFLYSFTFTKNQEESLELEHRKEIERLELSYKYKKK